MFDDPVSTSGRAMLPGLGGGLLLSLACGPLLRSYLYGLSALDPLAYGMVMALLAGTAALATLVPARRACRVGSGRDAGKTDRSAAASTGG